MVSLNVGCVDVSNNVNSSALHNECNSDFCLNMLLTEKHYSNPVQYSDGEKHTAPDPFVIRYRNLYYCYATDKNGVLVSTSTDMVRWVSHGYCYTENNRKNFWAPSVILINGIFYMYFSNMPQCENDTHTEIMRVAVSKNPLGPFEKKAELFDTFAIDSQVVVGDDNQLYMLYADNQACGLSNLRPGTSVMIDRMVSPYKREGSPKPLILPTMDEEIFARNRFGDGRDWHTVEGATYFTFRDKGFITYSANAYEHEDYFVGYSVATLPKVPSDRHIDKLSWVKQCNNGHFDPLIIRSDKVEGTGHNSIVKAPNGVDDWVVYHGRDASDELHDGTEKRVMRIDPLYYSEGLLDTTGPSNCVCDAPLSADVCTDFTDGIPSDWNIISGSAHVLEIDGQPSISSCDRDGFSAISPLISSTLTISLWVKGGNGPLGSRFGLIPRYFDNNNYTYVLVDVGLHCLQVIDSVSGIVRQINTMLPSDINLSYWHELVVSREYGILAAHFDGRYVATISDISSEQGFCGVIVKDNDSAISSFSAVNHVNLWGKSLCNIVNEINVVDRFRLTSNEVEPFNVTSSRMRLRNLLNGNRCVIDFALTNDRSESVINIGEYSLVVCMNCIDLLRDGKSIIACEEPSRLNLQDDARRDTRGRVLRTVRLAASDRMLFVHVRNHSWRLPFIGNKVVDITLSEASITGYTRTSLGISVDRSVERVEKGV